MDIIIRKIKNLQRIHPTASWLTSQRSFLLSEIARTQNPAKERKTLLVFPFFNFSNIFRPAFAITFSVIILVSCFATVGAIGASQNSLPGDLLYPVKTTLEKTQFTFTSDTANRTRLSIKFANQRMDEFNQLIERPQKKGNIQKTVKNFTEQLVNVQQEINSLKEKNAEKAAEVAKIINAQTSFYEDTLINSDEKLSYILPSEKEALKQDIDQALEELSKTKELTSGLVKEETAVPAEEPEEETKQEVVVPSDNTEKIESSSIQFEKIQSPTEEVEKIGQ